MRLQKIKDRFSQLQLSCEQIDCDESVSRRLYHQYIINKLKVIFETCSRSEDITGVFKQFFDEYWRMFQGTPLCYTAQANSPFTGLLCEIAEYVKDELNRTKGVGTDPLSAIQILMPTVSLDSLAPHLYPDLSDVDPRIVLKTHILGCAGQYLVPVSCLLKYDATMNFPPIINPYFDLYAHRPEMAYLSSDELRRLIGHSLITQELYEAKCALELARNSFSSDVKPNLLSQLRRLITELQYSSVQGIGQELKAGETGVVGIYQFSTFYEALSKEDRELIPEAVQQQIDAVFQYSSDLGKNRSIPSCSVMRRHELEAAVLSNESTLSRIGIQSERHAIQIEEEKERLERARTHLLDSISATGAYKQGVDHYGFPIQWIKKFRIDLTQEEKQSILKQLKWFTAQEIEDCCQDPDAWNLIISTLTLEGLAELSQQFQADQLVTFLNYFSDGIQGLLINTASQFVTVTMRLDKQKQVIYYEKFSNYLNSLIKSFFDFVSILNLIPEDERDIFYTKTKAKAMELMTLPKFADHIVLLSGNDRIRLFKDYRSQFGEGFFFTAEQLDKLGKNIEKKLFSANSYGNFLSILIVEFLKFMVSPSTLFSPLRNTGQFFVLLSVSTLSYFPAIVILSTSIFTFFMAFYKLLGLELYDTISLLYNTVKLLVYTAVAIALGTVANILSSLQIITRSLASIPQLFIDKRITEDSEQSMLTTLNTGL